MPTVCARVPTVAERGPLSGQIVAVDHIKKFAGVLNTLQKDPYAAHIRSGLLPGIDRSGFERLLNRQIDTDGQVREPCLIDVPRRHVLFDVDDVPAAEIGITT